MRQAKKPQIILTSRLLTASEVRWYNINNLFVRLPEQEVNMKQQPDKITAYYYRAANITKQT